ncbi:chemotaxis protein CheW [Parathalassolituus penaei]|uniref:Chemotaxis protein CheW n=1 Tax=Parathalassolituus penaei TaxID=2997323 RepID=A0A9X3EDD2_9GAMM|nr:chemotaxis protein CheW [Parathalassolituus penaei]MCY0965130.1 chemotaxis protein CheW [Parathalassolituus penaei]
MSAVKQENPVDGVLMGYLDDLLLDPGDLRGQAPEDISVQSDTLLSTSLETSVAEEMFESECVSAVDEPNTETVVDCPVQVSTDEPPIFHDEVLIEGSITLDNCHLGEDDEIRVEPELESALAAIEMQDNPVVTQDEERLADDEATLGHEPLLMATDLNERSFDLFEDNNEEKANNVETGEEGLIHKVVNEKLHHVAASVVDEFSLNAVLSTEDLIVEAALDIPAETAAEHVEITWEACTSLHRPELAGMTDREYENVPEKSGQPILVKNAVDAQLDSAFVQDSTIKECADIDTASNSIADHIDDIDWSATEWPEDAMADVSHKPLHTGLTSTSAPLEPAIPTVVIHTSTHSGRGVLDDFNSPQRVVEDRWPADVWPSATDFDEPRAHRVTPVHLLTVAVPDFADVTEITVPQPLFAPEIPMESDSTPETVVVATVDTNSRVSVRENTQELSETQQPPSINWRDSAGVDCLLFTVCGLKLAIPLPMLGGVHQVNEPITPLFGQAAWSLGVWQGDKGKLTIIDSAELIMPERGKRLADEGYQYFIQLDRSPWALACQTICNTVRLREESVKWRGACSKRPWLAGTVITEMCALIDVPGLLELVEQQRRTVLKRSISALR